MGTKYRKKKATPLGLQYPENNEKYSVSNEHHVPVLASTTITDFDKIPDASRDTKPVEHVRGEDGTEHYMIHRAAYIDIIPYQEERKLRLKDRLVLDYIKTQAADYVKDNKEAFTISLSYNKYFNETKGNYGRPSTDQKKSLIDSLEKLSRHFISFKGYDNSGEVVEGVTPFNMFTADYKLRGGIKIYITAPFNKYFLQRATAAPRSKVIQKMDVNNDAPAIEIMFALDTQMGRFDPAGVDENGHKFWRIKVRTLLEEIDSLKEAKSAAKVSLKLPPVKKEENKKKSPVHLIMIPFIKALNKCTADYNGTRGLLSWKFVEPGGYELSAAVKEKVTYTGEGTDTSKLDFNTFLDMTIEYFPFDPPKVRPRAERQERQEVIINKKMIRKSKAGKKKKD